MLDCINNAPMRGHFSTQGGIHRPRADHPMREDHRCELLLGFIPLLVKLCSMCDLDNEDFHPSEELLAKPMHESILVELPTSNCEAFHTVSFIDHISHESDFWLLVLIPFQIINIGKWRIIHWLLTRIVD